MNKSDLVDAIAAATDEGRSKVAAILETALDSISGALQRGDKVTLPGFGTFETRRRQARSGRNPRTGAPVKIAATTAPVFKAGATLKGSVGGKKTTARAGAKSKASARSKASPKAAAKGPAKATAKASSKAAAKSPAKASAKAAAVKQKAAPRAAAKATARTASKASPKAATKSPAKATAKAKAAARSPAKASAKKAAAKKR
jgi:DNA-binding protein HU-beta